MMTDESGMSQQRFEDSIGSNLLNNSADNEEDKTIKVKKTEKKSKFPSTYSILLIIQIVFFLFTYIFQKGLYDTIEYSSEKKMFIIRKNDKNNTIINVNATQEELDKTGVSVPLDSFLDNFINRPIRIPNTYKKIEDDTTNFLYLFLYPIKGLIESADISFFLLIYGGIIKVLEVPLSKLMKYLTNFTKKKKNLLLIIVICIFSLGGTTFGMEEEILSFYPILMPIFLDIGFDGLLSMAPLYFGVICGKMFCLINTTSVVLASILAGINYKDEIVFRIIGLVFAIIISSGYLIMYKIRVEKNPEKSIVKNINDDIRSHFDVRKRKNTEEKEGDNDDTQTNISKNTIKNEQLSLNQKISLIIFIAGFISLIPCVIIFKWSFLEQAAFYFILAVILMFLSCKGEKGAINDFIEGVKNYCEVVMITGIIRGLNLTLEEEKIFDTFLNSFSIMLEDLEGAVFGVLILIIYIILGLFIQTSSGMAMISIPPFAPLADAANCPRSVVVNSYLIGQTLTSLIAPTGLILIATQLVGIEYIYWLKFIWPYLLILFVFSFILIIIDSYLY